MEQHSINRRKIDWATLRTRAFERAVASQVPAETYMAIRLALMELGDEHSFFSIPEEAQAVDDGSQPLTLPSGVLLPDRIALIEVPAFTGNEAQALSYAEEAHAVIAKLDQANPCGWIVDLRNNTGGNMWPMLAGIGPVLGDGMAGAFADLDDHRIEYGYYAGAARIGQETVITVTTPYHLRAAMPTVAVLTNSNTASSGEAITVAFRGRPDTRSFGQATFGVSSGNEGFPLSDGAFIYLTTSVLADRTGVRYGQRILPDTVVVESREAAAKWLLEQSACRPA
jgi:carboxyl-terminal processing protease